MIKCIKSTNNSDQLSAIRTQMHSRAAETQNYQGKTFLIVFHIQLHSEHAHTHTHTRVYENTQIPTNVGRTSQLYDTHKSRR